MDSVKAVSKSNTTYNNPKSGHNQMQDNESKSNNKNLSFSDVVKNCSNPSYKPKYL